MLATHALSDNARERLAEPFSRLADTLRTAAEGREIVFMQNLGNFGDALIRHGTLRFFEDQGLKYREYDMGSRMARLAALAEGLASPLPPKKLFVHSGSGAWADVCDIGWLNVHRQARVGSSMFILPSTFQKYGLPEATPVFIRDTEESQATVPHAQFCHDMAFYLALIDPDRVLANRIPPSQGLGLMFRTDNEGRSHGFASLPGNSDVSTAGSHNSDPMDFLHLIDQFETVITDRLHIAIGASLLGKTTFIVPGNYFKIRAIWRSSMDGVFENCSLISDEDVPNLIAKYS